MKPRRATTGGFTLLELLVVLAIMAVVTGIGTVAFIQMTDYWSGLRYRTELDRRAEGVFDNIRDDLASVIASPLSSKSIAGTSENVKNAGELFFNIPLANDTLSIPTMVRDGAGNAVPTVVTYAVTREEDTDPTLVRSQRALGSEEAEAATQNVAAGVLQFRVEYTADGSEWVADWPEGALPRAIRVSLNLAVPGNPLLEQVARERVFPVHVQ